MAFQCIRSYRFNPETLDEVTNSLRWGLLPRLEAQPGFLGYRFMSTADDRALSMSDWNTYAEAASADAVEAEWVRSSIHQYLAALPEQWIGVISIDKSVIG